MSSVIRSLVVKVGADISGLEKGLNKAAKQLNKTGKELSNTGKALTNTFTKPILGAATALGGIAVKASETADEVLTMSQKLGVSTESFQKLQYASELVDVSVETMAKGMAKVVKATGDAAKKGLDYIGVADGINVQTKDANGNLKDSETLFYDTIDALTGMTDETQRDIAAQQLFGKSYQDLLPLINQGSDALKKYGDEAVATGAVMSGDTLNSLGSFNDSIQRIKSTVSAAGSELGAAFVPLLEKLTPLIQEKIIPAIQGFAEKITNLIEWFVNLNPKTQEFIGKLILFAVAIGPVMMGVGGLVTNIGALIKGVSGAISMVKGIGSALTLLTSPVGLVIAGIAALAAAAYLIIKNWEPIKAFFIGLWEGITSAFNGAWNGIKSVLNFMIGGIEGFVNGFVKGINTVVRAVNRIQINVPDWMTKLTGVKDFGFNLKTVGELKIPRLAEGAVIPPNSEFLAMLGDQKHGVNIETPLSTMIEAFKAASGDITIYNPLYLDSDKLNKATSKKQYSTNKARSRGLGTA